MVLFLPYNPREDADTLNQRAYAWLLDWHRDNNASYVDMSTRHAIIERGIRFYAGNDEIHLDMLNTEQDEFVFSLTSQRHPDYGDQIVAVVENTLAVRMSVNGMDTRIDASNTFAFEQMRNILVPFLSSQGNLGTLRLRYRDEFRNYPLNRGAYVWPSVRPSTGLDENVTQIFFGSRPRIGNATLEMQSIGNEVERARDTYGYFTVSANWIGDLPEDVRGAIMYTQTHGKWHPLCYRAFHPHKVIYWLDGGFGREYARPEYLLADAQKVLEILMLSEEVYMEFCATQMAELLVEGRTEFARQLVANSIGNIDSVQQEAASARQYVDEVADSLDRATRAYTDIERRLAFMLTSQIPNTERIETVLRETQEIDSLATVDTLSFRVGGVLEIITNPLRCHSDHRGEMVWKDVGKVKIIIDASGQDAVRAVSLYNITHPTLGGSCHQYGRPGGTCWGNARRPLNELLASGDLQDLVVYIINFIESPPASDGWYMFDQYPTIPTPS